MSDHRTMTIGVPPATSQPPPPHKKKPTHTKNKQTNNRKCIVYIIGEQRRCVNDYLAG